MHFSGELSNVPLYSWLETSEKQNYRRLVSSYASFAIKQTSIDSPAELIAIAKQSTTALLIQKSSLRMWEQADRLMELVVVVMWYETDLSAGWADVPMLAVIHIPVLPEGQPTPQPLTVLHCSSTAPLAVTTPADISSLQLHTASDLCTHEITPASPPNWGKELRACYPSLCLLCMWECVCVKSACVCVCLCVQRAEEMSNI